MEGLADCIGYGYAEVTIVEFSYAEAMLPFCTNSLPERLSQLFRWGLSTYLKEHWLVVLKFRSPLTFNKLELLVTSTPLPHRLGTRDTCFARVATAANLVQTPGKNPSL
eukprot:symbB.v1.2.025580.t1/scaffold2490.1/size77860/2